MCEDSDSRERPSDVDDPVPDDPTPDEDVDPTPDDETRPDNEPLPDYEPPPDDGPAADPTSAPPAGEAPQPTPDDEPGLRHGGEPVPVPGEPVPTAEAHDDPDAQPTPQLEPTPSAEPAPEPQPALLPQPDSGPAVLWTDESANRLRDQWRDVRLRFVDDPRAAADEAQRLVGGAIDELSAALAARRADLDAWATTDPDTEALRLAVRRYRDLLDRLLDL